MSKTMSKVIMCASPRDRVAARAQLVRDVMTDINAFLRLQDYERAHDSVNRLQNEVSAYIDDLTIYVKEVVDNPSR